MHHRPKKWLGQNFLRDRTVIDRIVKALVLTGDEAVVEIGPGLGALTEALIDSGAQVLAIEVDHDLVDKLGERFKSTRNFRLIPQDALDVDYRELTAVLNTRVIKLVANLPYNISTPILQRLIMSRMVFSTMVLMFQREVVERITAKTGTSDRGFLTVLVEDAFMVERLFDVGPEAFYPPPKVWSSVVRLTPRASEIADQEFFRDLVSASFRQKRKTLQNNLKGFLPDPSFALTTAGIDPSRRAETLTSADWKALVDAARAH